MYCDIPMATLVASPYLLTYGNYVYARVSAYNSIGWNSASSNN